MSRKSNPVSQFSLAALMLALLLPAGARAGIVYLVTVDTSAIRNTAGFLDFDFAPGSTPQSQAAFVQIGSFSPAGGLSGAPQVSGGGSGTLPAVVSLDNSTSFNDYFQGFNYGDAIAFSLSFGGPAIDSPNGTATFGSKFGFGMFDSNGDALLTSDPNVTFTVDVNPDGTTSLTSFSPNAQAALASSVPEPEAPALLALALVGFLTARRGCPAQRPVRCQVNP